MKTIKLFKTLSLFFISLLFISTGIAQTLESKIDNLLEESYKQDGPGAVALVAKDGNVIYRKAFGNANLELGVPMIPENIFELGSITKQFTSVSILMLLEQGKLKLDDEITKFLPDYPTHGKTITVHHLLTHTSGIKSYTSMEGIRDIARKELSPIELIDFFKNEDMDFEPGEEYRYNNSGYIILGYIIEKLSDQSYAEFVAENIFEKIGMNASTYGSMTKIIKNRASGYQDNDGYVNANFLDLSIPYAAGSLMSNVDDMLKWQQAIKKNVIIKQETIDLAFTNYTLNNGEAINYGYGWGLNDLNGVPSIEHGGGIFGFTTQGVYVPSEDLYVIVLTNCSCNSPGTVTTKIAALAIGKPYPDLSNVVALNKQELEKWVGAYEFEAGVVRFIKLEGEQLLSQREGSSVFKIYPLTPNRFYFEGGLIEYSFSENEGKRKVIFKNRKNISNGVETDKEPEAEKESIAVLPSILNQYVGKYELQPGFVLEVTTKGNQLYAQATGQPIAELFAETDTSFFLKVVAASIDFNKGDDGDVTSLTLHQGGQDMEGKRIE